MVDEIAANSPAAPVASANSSAEVAVTAPVAEAVTTPVPEVIAVETPVVAESVDAPKAETLLGSEKSTEAKPVEVKPEAPAEVKAEEKPIEVAPVEVPTYEPFTLPENMQMDEAKMSDFTKFLSEFEVNTKVSHEEMQKLGQQMLDRHIEGIQRYTETLTHAFEKQKTEWKDSFLKDPEFANRKDTVIKTAGEAINTYGGTKEQIDSFYDLMESSGIGNHPAQIRMINNLMGEITRLKGKYESEKDVKQLAAPQIASTERGSKISRMYGKK